MLALEAKKIIILDLKKQKEKMENFQILRLPESLNKSLEAMEFKKPTPIQVQAIPAALEGRDILGSAQTGTGKTAAFGIPLITNLLLNPGASAIVMTPTRELAMQVLSQLKLMLGRESAIKATLLIGGESMLRQFQQLRRNPRLIVGTPGRINDHLERGSLLLKSTGFLVLDETDRMLDMGFTLQIQQILKFMPKKRQTLLFSATLPEKIEKISEKYLINPVRVSVDETLAVGEKIKQEIVKIDEADKFLNLVSQIKAYKGSVLVFMKTKFAAERMSVKLSKQGHKSESIHGNLSQNKRNRVIKGFRDQKYRILVATDVAARGLDIAHIECVVNYNLPQCAEDYVHRIGRTARAGAEGVAVCFVTPAEERKWKLIQRTLDSKGVFEGGLDSKKSSSQNKRGSYQGLRQSESDRPKRYRSEGGCGSWSSKGKKSFRSRSERSEGGCGSWSSKGKKSFRSRSERSEGGDNWSKGRFFKTGPRNKKFDFKKNQSPKSGLGQINHRIRKKTTSPRRSF